MNNEVILQLLQIVDHCSRNPKYKNILAIATKQLDEIDAKLGAPKPEPVQPAPQRQFPSERKV